MTNIHPFCNVADWAAEQASDIKHSCKKDLDDIGGVYLAVIESDEGWDIEIEVNEGTIHAVYRTCLDDLDKARDIADEIEDVLVASGVRVFKTRDDWEEALFESDQR